MGGGTVTPAPAYTFSGFMKDGGQLYAMVGGTLAAMGAVPEPASPLLLPAGICLMTAGAAGYAIGMAAQLAGY